MSHRPYCAAAALGLLVAALNVGPLFRCPGPAETQPLAAPRVTDAPDATAVRRPTSATTSAATIRPPAPLSDTLEAVPVEASASRRVQSAGFDPGQSFSSLVVPASFSNGPADPDHVGPCPQVDLPAVLRRGRDADGQDTWWHADGSITKRGTRTIAGQAVPFVMRMPATPESVGRDTPVRVVDHEPVVGK